jgi:hypothetical protein
MGCVILKKELHLGVFQFMWSLLWCKTLVFCVGGAACMTLAGFSFEPIFCTTYSDLVWTGWCHRVAIVTSFNMLMTLWCTRHAMYLNCLCLGSDGLLVTQCIFFAAWTHDILYKVGGGIVLSEALAASGLDPDWWEIVAKSFKYLGVFFDAGLRWEIEDWYVL